MPADTGPIGGDLSHEFIILAETGESKIYTDKNIFNIDIEKYNFDNNSLEKMLKDYSSVYAATDDKFEKSEFDKKVDKKNQVTTKRIEWDTFFILRQILETLIFVDNQKGKKTSVKMGSYGIGVSRLVGAIIEAKYERC